MSKTKLSQEKLDQFANAIGLGNAKTLLQTMAAEYYRGSGVGVEFSPPTPEGEGLPMVKYFAVLSTAPQPGGDE